jgi:hypothetical protein
MAMLVVSPKVSTRPVRYGVAHDPSIRLADSPSRIIAGPSAYRFDASWRT